MLRRSLAAAIGAGASQLAGPVLAQVPAPPRAYSSAPRSLSWVTPGPPMTVQDLALLAGRFSAQSSDIAKARATSPALRQFAVLESEEQAAVTRALEVVGAKASVPDPLPPEKLEVLRRLEVAQGSECDRIYFMAQVVGHHELLQLQAASSLGAGTPEERAIATILFATVRAHLAMLHALEAEIGA